MRIKLYLIYFLMFLPVLIHAENYAFLISAGKATQDDNATAVFWYDLFLAYRCLIIEQGYTHENVHVFYGDGLDWTGTKYDKYKKETYDWDVPIVDFANDSLTLRTEIGNLANSITDNDNVLIWWVVGHGRSPDGPDDYIARIINWGSDYELSETYVLYIFNQIENYKRRKIIWMTCHSGALAQGQLNFNNDNTTIITCSDWNVGCLYYWPYFPDYSDGHSIFNWCITSSLYGEDPLGNSYDGDSDGDHVTSFTELYVDADTNPLEVCNPVIGDDCPMADYLYVDEDLLLEDCNLTGTRSYRVDDITAENNLQIPSGADVTFAVDKEIVMGPGFTAHSGSDYHAYVGYIQCPPGGIVQPSDLSGIGQSSNNNSTFFKISPNPVRSIVEIEYYLSEKSNVSISVYDYYGQIRKEIISNNAHPEGLFKVRFDVSDLPSGVYFVKFVTPCHTETKQVLLIR